MFHLLHQHVDEREKVGIAESRLLPIVDIV